MNLVILRALRWFLWWAWYSLRLAAIGGAIAFFCFHGGQPLAGFAVSLVTAVLLIVIVVLRARDMRRLAAAKMAKTARAVAAPRQ